ncbi:MAG: peptide chain release factor N(5)-glutamine methyltransferase [Propionibacteriaceae bacterium]
MIPEHERRQLAAALVGWEAAHRPGGYELTAAQETKLEALIARREKGEPLQHITGRAFFRHEELMVGPGVFIPRPETEAMVGWALAWLRSCGIEQPRVVELCAGSGAISRAIAREAAGLAPRQWAVELSDEALTYLTWNLAETDIEIVPGAMEDALHQLDGTVDLVIANPPYIPLEAWASIPRDVRDYDPHLALFSGDDGLDATRVVARVAHRLLANGGVVCSEHAEVQHEVISEVFLAHGGFDHIRDHQDLTDRWRFVTATRIDKE